MPKELVIAASPHETRVAILEDGQLCEIYIEREKEFALVGSIYKGKVTRVLPGMQSAFVDIALDSDAFLYVGDFFENLEDYDHVVTTVEGKVEKMEQQGGAVFAKPITGSSPLEIPAPENPSPEAGSAEPLADDNRGNTEEFGTRETSQLPTGAKPFSPGPSNFQRQDRPPRNFGRGQGQGQRQGQGQGQGQRGGEQSGRGSDQGGRGGDQSVRRGGRWGRGRGGRGGRDLPPSKYASPKPFAARPQQETSTPADTFEPPENYQPVILPGESLAKYKDRIPGAPTSSQTGASSGNFSSSSSRTSSGSSAVSAPETTAGGSRQGFGENLPSSLYASPVSQREEPVTRAQETASEAAAAHEEEVAANDSEVFADYQPIPDEPLRVIADPHHESAAATHAPELSDEEMTVIAEQVAEARQEEAAAHAAEDAAAALSEHDEHADQGDHEEHGDHGEHGEHDDGMASAEDAEPVEYAAVLDEAAAIGPSEDEAAIDHIVEPGNEMPSDENGEAGAEMAGEGEPLTEAREAGGEHQPTSARVSGPQRPRFQRPMRRGGRQQRGHRPDRNRDHRHQQPRRPQLIAEVLKAGQEIIVQIAKEPLGKKGARITSHIALPGRFLVYMPTVNHIGVSRRIASAEERSRLRHLVTDSKGTFPGGFIVRTAAEGAPDDEIRADVEFLGRTWEKIRTQAEPRKAPALLHRDLNLVERILRDYLSNDYTAIWIDNEEEYSKVVEFVGRFQPKLVSRVKLYTKPAPIFEEFGIQQELDRALRPKVWLKSGGYIVINHTEALVAIDVNTGKYVGRGSNRLEDTIVKTNLEAVKEIIRQIRLRDLGGIIVLDFIDMEERRNREKVMQALDSALRADRAPSKALPFNEFGLVCVTRKRTKQALERVLCQPCPYCTGSGMVKSVPTICYEIQAEARKMAGDMDAGSITLRVHPEIAKALKTREATLIEELEQGTRKSIIITADPSLHWEQYDIY